MVKSEDTVKKLLREFIRLLEGDVRLYAVVLFGSYARGTPEEFSDIDVAVFSEDFGENPLDDMKKLFKLRRKIDTYIEPLTFSKQDFMDHSKADFIEEILRSGKIIYKDGAISL